MRTARLLACALVLSAPALSRGGDQEVASGWEGGASSGYAYVLPAFSFDLKSNWSLVLSGGPSYYSYEAAESDGTTKIASAGLEASLMLRVKTRRLSLTFGPGFEARKTSFDYTIADDVELDERGATWKGDLFVQPTPLWTFSMLESYGDVNKYLWLRTGLKRQITNTSFHGPRALAVGGEVTVAGNTDSRELKAGGLFEIAWLEPYVSLQLRGGVERSSVTSRKDEVRAYAGIGFYRRF